MKTSNIGSLLITLLCPVLLFAQQEKKSIRSYTEKSYRYRSDEDSIPLLSQNISYDELGRMTFKQRFEYANHPPATLRKEQFAQFDPETMVLDERITYYTKGRNPKTESMKTYFMEYAADEASSKHYSRIYIDRTGEIVKEDTLSYNDQGLLTQQCLYNYGGNTSLYCDHWKYNKKGQLKKWLLYSYYTTVNWRSKVVTKKERKQKYCYRYNKKGQPKKTRGKQYATKLYEDWTYSKDGVLTAYHQRQYRKARNSEKRRKDTGKKFTIFQKELIRSYQNGQLVTEVQLVNGKETYKQEISYLQDSLPQQHLYYKKGIKSKEEKYNYDQENRLTTKLVYHYNSKGQLKYYVQNDYNPKGQLIKSTQIIKEQVQSYNLFEYNANGDKVSDTLYVKNNIKFEKTLYFYEYH